MTPAIPTAAELAQAQKEIQADGPGAQLTAALALLAVKDPTLLRTINAMMDARMMDVALEATGVERAVMQSLLSGAIMTGLNLGLRIGAARAADQK